MTWNEFIHIRAHADIEAKEVVATFYRLSLSPPEKNLVDIALMRNLNVVNDFSLRLTWQGELPETEKSPLGYQLAAAFSDMGWVQHSVWLRETSLFLHNGRSVHGKK